MSHVFCKYGCLQDVFLLYDASFLNVLWYDDDDDDDDDDDVTTLGVYVY